MYHLSETAYIDFATNSKNAIIPISKGYEQGVNATVLSQFSSPNETLLPCITTSSLFVCYAIATPHLIKIISTVSSILIQEFLEVLSSDSDRKP